MFVCLNVQDYALISLWIVKVLLGVIIFYADAFKHQLFSFANFVFDPKCYRCWDSRSLLRCCTAQQAWKEVARVESGRAKLRNSTLETWSPVCVVSFRQQKHFG